MNRACKYTHTHTCQGQLKKNYKNCPTPMLPTPMTFMGYKIFN